LADVTFSPSGEHKVTVATAVTAGLKEESYCSPERKFLPVCTLSKIMLAS